MFLSLSDGARNSLMMLTFVILPLVTLLFTTGGLADENDIEDRYMIQNQCLEALQQQINEELQASLVYLNMAAHFQHSSVARKGFFKFFEQQSDEEKKHAHKLIAYMNKRGGRTTSFNVVSPKKAVWQTAEEAVRDAIELEKDLNIKLHNVHKNAERLCADPHLMDFIETEFLEEQISSIRELTKIHTVLSSFEKENRAMGEYLVDQQLLKEETRQYFDEL